MAAPVDPYVPQPVPDTSNPELERFLAEELARISSITESLAGSAVGAYGGLSVTNVQVNTLGGTPAKLQNYNTLRPASREEGVSLDAVNGEITINSGGAYYVRCKLCVFVDSGTLYLINLYNNGSPTGALSALDVADTQLIVETEVNLMETFQPGDVLSVYNSANLINSNFIVIRADFTAFRVSEVI